MFGCVPRLPIDIEYGVTQPELIDKSRQNYARKLRARLNWAFKVAKDVNLEESERRYYDRKMHCQKLVVGDVVLVKEKGSSSNYKINDKWEQTHIQCWNTCETIMVNKCLYFVYVR